MTEQEIQQPGSPDEHGTVVRDKPEAGAGAGAAPVTVTWLVDGQKRSAEFGTGVTIGRQESCDVRLDDDGVSRQHAKLYLAAGRWLVRDLGSGNGTFLDGVRIQKASLPRNSTLRLGADGPMIWIEAPDALAGASVEDIAAHYFGDSSDNEVGHRTLMFRRAWRRIDRKKKHRYRGIIAGIAGLLSLSIAVGLYQFQMLRDTRALALDMFYNMKTLQVQVGQLEAMALDSADAARLRLVDARRREMSEMEASYDRLLSELEFLGSELSEQDQIILRVARMFGECELNMPDAFVDEVNNYIGKWKSTDQLENGLRRMHEQELGPIIAATLLEHHLPPQFLYLALKESGFDMQAVGPETRFGIAKGLWQFIPATAWHYGLRTGPLVEVGRHDPLDERFHTELSTEAAAHYLSDIYNREAQASGLLVIASYNWGPSNVRKLIREMPDNPRDKNFWKLLQQHDIPQETYDYVFYIVSAIVIGENPALFGFDFENPLDEAMPRPGMERI